MRIYRLGMAVALSLLFTASLDAQAIKIGYVHAQEVLAQYPPSQAAFDRLESANNSWLAELQTLAATRDQLLAEFQQQQMSMTPEARQALDQQIRVQEAAIATRQREVQNESQQLQDELLQPIMAEITAVIEEIRVELGYALILDANSNAILAADESLNLTQEVLTRLEEKGAADGGR